MARFAPAVTSRATLVKPSPSGKLDHVFSWLITMSSTSVKLADSSPIFARRAVSGELEEGCSCRSIVEGLAISVVKEGGDFVPSLTSKRLLTLRVPGNSISDRRPS